MLELLYGTGIRVSELCSLSISDIDFYNETILVAGKGNKERYPPIYDSIKNALLDYLEFARPSLLARSGNTDEKRLFLNFHGGPLTQRGVRVIINDICLRAAINQKAHPICSGTRSRRTYLTTGRICGVSRNSWDTPTCRRRRYTRTFRKKTYAGNS